MKLEQRKGISTAVVAVIVIIIVAAAVGGVYLATRSGTSTSSTTVSTTSSPTTSTSTSTSQASTNNSASTLNIGYFANLNHAQAIVGVADGEFQSYLGPSTKIVPTIFSSGPTEMTALLASKLDMAFVGPDPAVNAFIQSNGTGLQILAGAASGGAEFVVTNSSGITPGDVKDLGGKTFAAPGLGNTQDVALRHYLLENGFKTTTAGGNVTVEDTSNSNIVTLFATGKIDGAWVPAPWGQILISQGGKLFLDERSLWPKGQFTTAVLVVRTAYLQAHPDVVKDIVEAEVQETIKLNSNLTAAEQLLNAQYAVLTGAPLNSTVLAEAMTTLTLSYDPLESTINQQAQNEFQLGFLTTQPTNATLAGIYNLTFLNEALTSDGLPAVTN